MKQIVFPLTNCNGIVVGEIVYNPIDFNYTGYLFIPYDDLEFYDFTDIEGIVNAISNSLGHPVTATRFKEYTI